MKLPIENPGQSSAAEARKLAIMLCRRGYVNIEPPETAPKKDHRLESIPEALKRKHGRSA